VVSSPLSKSVVVYDLSLRGLLPKNDGIESGSENKQVGAENGSPSLKAEG
jgi:hypothetical protein